METSWPIKKFYCELSCLDGRNGRGSSAFLPFPLPYEKMRVLLELEPNPWICFVWNCSLDSNNWRSCKLLSIISAISSAVSWPCVIKMLDGQTVPPYGLLYTAWWTLMPIYEHLPVLKCVTAYFIQSLQYCNAMQMSYSMMDMMWLWFMLCVMSANILYVIIITWVYIHTQQM